jgi:hypothetical protein
MRALRFCGLTLAVAGAHLAAWQAASPRPLQAPAAMRTRAEARHVAWVAVASSAGMPSAAARLRPDAADAPAARPRPRASGVPAARPTSPHPPGAAASRRDAVRWPIYATRPPPSTRLEYRLQQVNPRGALPAGRAVLAWSRDAGAFSLLLATTLPGRPPREWRSEGGFDAAGIAPRRLAQRDRGRETHIVELDPARASVGLPGRTPVAGAAPGVQDRWSWIAQLAAIAEAAGGRIGTVHVQVAGLRGELEHWAFHAVPGVALPPGAAGQVPAALPAAPLLHLVREPEHPFDLRVELWSSPATHHLPIALRLSTPPGRWSFELWLESAADTQDPS